MTVSVLLDVFPGHGAFWTVIGGGDRAVTAVTAGRYCHRCHRAVTGGGDSLSGGFSCGNGAGGSGCHRVTGVGVLAGMRV